MEVYLIRIVAWLLGIVGALIGALAVVLWYNFREMNVNIKGVWDELGKLRVHLAENYVTKHDLERHREDCPINQVLK